MFVCNQNPKTAIGYFYMYLSVIDYRNLYVVLMLFQRLNLLRNEHFSFKTTDICLFFWSIFFIMSNFLSFFTVYNFWLSFQQQFVCNYSIDEETLKLEMFMHM